MKEIKVMESDEKFGGFYWPSIMKRKDGSLYVACSGLRLKHVCPFGKVVSAYSYDNGETWSEPSIILDTPLDDRDAGLCEFKDKIYLTSFNNSRASQEMYVRMWKYEGEDKAIIEKRLSEITEDDEQRYLGANVSVSSDNGKTFGDYKLLPLTSPHGMTVLNDGRMLYVGRHFFDEMLTSKEDKKRLEGIKFITTTDGINYSEPVVIPMPKNMVDEGYLFCEPHCIQLKSGRILIHIRVQKGNECFTVFDCYSDDNLKTFSSVKHINTKSNDFYGSPPHLMQHSSGAVVMVYGRRKKPHGERAVVSFDDGMTWSDEIILTTDTNESFDLGYPASVELPSGEIFTVYYRYKNKNAGIYGIKWRI